jgi:hypothetical protein
MAPTRGSTEKPGPEQLTPAEEDRLWELTAEGTFLFADELVESVATGAPVQIPNGIADLLKLGGAGISDTLAGALPLAWRPNKKRKPNYLAGSERVAIRYASAYYALVDAGLISDNTPTATISRLFAVKSSTARSWRKADNKQQYDVYIDRFSELSWSTGRYAEIAPGGRSGSPGMGWPPVQAARALMAHSSYPAISGAIEIAGGVL